MQFNDTKETVAERTKSTNYEGGPSYAPDSVELRLTKNVINNLLTDSFYEEASDSFRDVVEAVDACIDENPEFVLKLAKYARQEENLRQVPQLLLVLSANDESTQPYVRDYATSIMSRADEPLEAIAMQVGLSSSDYESVFANTEHFSTDDFGRTLPNSLRKSIEDALHQFNEYKFAKWDRPSREWRFRDLLNLVHPTPRDEERDRIFEKIVKGDLDEYPEVGSLKQEDTWEDAQSAAGQDEDMDSAEVWREQLRENEDGYSMPIFARIRNVRNMLEDGLTGEEIFGDDCGPRVTDEWVENSGLWPFRFYQAYKAIRESEDAPNDRFALEWLENAMTVSAKSIPDVFDNTFTAVDTSGSMSWSTVSEHSNLTPKEIGALFGAIMVEHDSDVGAFARNFERLDPDPRDTTMTNMQNIARAGPGGGTHGHKVPNQLRRRGEVYDKVILFTDLQLWGGNFESEWRKYKKEVAPSASLYLVDLEAYGDLVTPEGTQDVYNISGWSTNVLDFIAKMERAGEMVAEIEEVSPDS